MSSWTSYPVFIATVVSVVGLSRIAVRQHGGSPKTLSELAAAEQTVLFRFRNILLFCGVLFAITVFGYIVPRVVHPALVAVFGALMIGGELTAAIIPARNNTLMKHYVVAQVMAVGMFGMAVLFWIELPKYVIYEVILTILMFGMAVLTLADKSRYLFYELVFIFSSHLTVVVATAALH